MDEILQKLLEAEILTEDTKKDLEEAIQSTLTEAVETAKTEAEATVRAELTEQWIQERDTLIEAVDTKVSDFLETEISELREDVERFRDLEAEYAQKLVEAKGEMSEELKKDLAELVEKLDAFLEIRLNAEMEELHEDIQEVRKNEMGRRIFEAFAAEYTDNYADEDDSEATLRETQAQLEEAMQALAEAETQLAEKERSDKMAKVLSPLSGRSREVMEAILRNVATDQLEEGYKTFIGRVLKESDEETSEKENSVLAEGDEVKEKELVKAEVKTGDDKALTEHQEKEDEEGKVGLSESAKERLRKLGGLV